MSVDVFRAAASEAGPVAELRRELGGVFSRRRRASSRARRARAWWAAQRGKSSLLNALAGREVAIVSSEPGTTRDAVEATLVLGGRVAVVADTAGARAARARRGGGRAARPGSRRRRRRRRAGAGRRVLRGARALPRWALERADVLVLNKADLGEETTRRCAALSGFCPCDAARRASDVGNARDVRRRRRDALAGRRAAEIPTARVSCATGRGMDALAEVLRGGGGAARARSPGTARASPHHARATRALRECVHHLGAFAAEAASETGRHEVAAEELRLAARALGRVTGAVGVGLLDVIFATFASASEETLLICSLALPKLSAT